MAYGQSSLCNEPLGDPPRSGSPLDREGSGGSSVVFTEGVDPSPVDWGKRS